MTWTLYRRCADTGTQQDGQQSGQKQRGQILHHRLLIGGALYPAYDTQRAKSSIRATSGDVNRLRAIDCQPVCR
jgi:hypothetical protein